MDSLFRGYVPTRDKKSLMPFKNKVAAELNTYDQVKNLPEYAGVLADDVILIDVDDRPQSELMMQIVEDKQLRCRVYETRKGKHFVFKNDKLDRCKTKTRLACGLVNIDIKVGKRNSIEVLKFDGKERPIIYDKLEDEEYENVPKWLMPISTKMDFLDKAAGDGRNQSLFNYILTLQAADYSVDEARECIRIINKYVLKDKLDDTELETILRDEAFNKPVFFKDKTFLFDKFATYLKNNSHIIKINGRLHIYKDGIYVDGSEKIEAEMIKNIPSLNYTKRMEVMRYLNVLIQDDTPVADAKYIAFKNGVYDLDTCELKDFNPSLVITNRIPHDYNPDAYSELADRTFNKMACGDASVRALLEEAIGYCFYRRNEGLRKAFILIGDKQNGKSTYLSMIECLLGTENVTNLDLKELGDRFKTAELFGKLANIGDDIGDEFIPNPAVFKKLVTGNSINAERKGEKPFDFSNYAKLLFSANNMPRIKDKSGAVMSRLVIIPFDARFTSDDPDFDPFIKYKLIQEEPMQYLINIGLEGLKRILAEQHFTKSERVQKELDEYEHNNNPILLFFDEIREEEIENEPTSTAYKKYTEFCIANSFTAMSNIEFSKQVKKHFNFDISNRKIKNKKYRVFVRK